MRMNGFEESMSSGNGIDKASDEPLILATTRECTIVGPLRYHQMSISERA